VGRSTIMVEDSAQSCTAAPAEWLDWVHFKRALTDTWQLRGSELGALVDDDSSTTGLFLEDLGVQKKEKKRD